MSGVLKYFSKLKNISDDTTVNSDRKRSATICVAVSLQQFSYVRLIATLLNMHVYAKYVRTNSVIKKELIKK
jgi:hypothetical protein